MTITSSRKLWAPHVEAGVEDIEPHFPLSSAGTYPSAPPSDHPHYACDFMIPKWAGPFGIAYGGRLAAYAWKNSKRLGIHYVIWRGRIISNTHPERGWTHYFNAGNPNPSKSHKNHVHVSWDHTSPLAGIVYLDRLKPGVKDSDSVRLVQRALRTLGYYHGVNGKVTGEYGSRTVAGVKTWQAKLGDDVDGKLGPLQTEALFKAAKMRVSIEKKA